MEEFYYDTITFLSEMHPLVKCLLVGILTFLVVFSVIKIVKTHVNPKKSIFKIGQFILLAILIAITIFVCVHVV